MASYKLGLLTSLSAHNIRNRQTNQFKAVSRLSAKHRWCLTGTPIQNSLEDLGALVSFLKVPVLERPSTFRKFITSPTASSSRDRFRNLQTLLQTICIRRTKQLLELPPPIARIHKVQLTPSERQEYDNLMQQAKSKIEEAVSGHIKNKVNSIMLNSLLKLRLFCNNGSTNNVLQIAPTGLPSDPDEALTHLEQYGLNICAYCSATIYSINSSADTDGGIFISPCCHLVCPNCTPQHRSEKDRCPTCAPGNESIIPEISLPPGFSSHSYSGPVYTGIYPSKLLALLSDIRSDVRRKRYSVLHLNI
jgi:SWI/SNF-related matrix-associated actin-dependent regulator of chromatin subfamily A3